MFKGKVYVYKNINWKEEKIEREFDNPQEFQSFAKTNNVWWLERFADRLTSPMLWLWEWANLQNYFDNLIDRRLWLNYKNWDDENQDNYVEWSLIDLNKYEQELEKIEYQKQHKDESLKLLKNSLHKLKEYKKRFKDEWREDIIESIDSDIKKVEEEIAKLGK
jgi:hypothetical protein